MQEFSEQLMAALGAVVRERCASIVDEEVEAANARVRERMKAEIDRFALAVTSQYSIQIDRNNLIITVDRRALDAGNPRT